MRLSFIGIDHTIWYIPSTLRRRHYPMEIKHGDYYIDRDNIDYRQFPVAIIMPPDKFFRMMSEVRGAWKAQFDFVANSLPLNVIWKTGKKIELGQNIDQLFLFANEGDAALFKLRWL